MQPFLNGLLAAAGYVMTSRNSLRWNNVSFFASVSRTARISSDLLNIDDQPRYAFPVVSEDVSSNTHSFWSRCCIMTFLRAQARVLLV